VLSVFMLFLRELRGDWPAKESAVAAKVLLFPPSQGKYQSIHLSFFLLEALL